jgi:hypothetical protein
MGFEAIEDVCDLLTLVGSKSVHVDHEAEADELWARGDKQES